MPAVGDLVRVIAPFDYAFPATYAITERIDNTDGTTVFVLGEAGGFDPMYLEAA